MVTTITVKHDGQRDFLSFFREILLVDKMSCFCNMLIDMRFFVGRQMFINPLANPPPTFSNTISITPSTLKCCKLCLCCSSVLAFGETNEDIFLVLGHGKLIFCLASPIQKVNAKCGIIFLFFISCKKCKHKCGKTIFQR